MKDAIIIGSGISGLSCAVHLAQAGVSVLLVSPFPSERSQSVMAAGGINAVLSDPEPGDSLESHIEDTLKGGRFLAGKGAVTDLCANAESVIRYLEKLGTVFSVDENGQPDRRAFGGQSYKRTCFCGASTGKQIVSALVMEARRFEAAGMIRRRLWSCFHSALIRDGVCRGVLLFDEKAQKLEEEYADAVVMASGGQNSLFGKTTGSLLCDGYAAGRLFQQGAELKNLEFIQYHPTTLETTQKKILVTEAARGEGGRLFFPEDGKRVYFMEDEFGPNGNLMTRDLISRKMFEILQGRGGDKSRNIFLDISFLDKKQIRDRLFEVQDLCMKYRGIDVTREPIPVTPSVHFFMGGLAVFRNHETSIQNLFAIGECASMYHGANRLGGNSLLAALHSAFVCANEIAGRMPLEKRADFSLMRKEEEEKLKKLMSEKSQFPVFYIRDMLAETMNQDLGIVRDETSLENGIKDVEYYLSVADRIRFDRSVLTYTNYSLQGILTLAKAALICAKERKESRGAHFRKDYPEENPEMEAATIISCDGDNISVRLDKERAYES